MLKNTKDKIIRHISFDRPLSQKFEEYCRKRKGTRGNNMIRMLVTEFMRKEGIL